MDMFVTEQRMSNLHDSIVHRYTDIIARPRHISEYAAALINGAHSRIPFL